MWILFRYNNSFIEGSILLYLFSGIYEALLYIMTQLSDIQYYAKFCLYFGRIERFQSQLLCLHCCSGWVWLLQPEQTKITGSTIRAEPTVKARASHPHSSVGPSTIQLELNNTKLDQITLFTDFAQRDVDTDWLLSPQLTMDPLLSGPILQESCSITDPFANWLWGNYHY